MSGPAHHTAGGITRPSPYRWVVLVAGVAAQAISGLVLQGLPSIAPQLRAEYGIGLPAVGLLLACVTVGLLVGLLPWGMLSDRFGERWVMTGGLFGAAAIGSVASTTGSPVALGAVLVLTGACAASVNAASGRAVLGWFPVRQRGMAMGIRQTALPLGAAAGALALPAVVEVSGVPAVFLTIAGACAVGSLVVGLLVREAPAPASVAARPSPLRDGRIRRLTAVSATLTVPQFAVVSFLVLYLVEGHGVAAGTAALLLAAVQVVGGAARVGLGWFSDRLGSQLALLVVVAASTCAAFAVLTVFAGTGGGACAVVLVLVGPLAICWNGLAFTAVGEIAAPGAVGTALALQNTAVALGSALTPPVLGSVVEHGSWSVAFAVAGCCAGAGVLLLLPLRRAERVERSAQAVRFLPVDLHPVPGRPGAFRPLPAAPRTSPRTSPTPSPRTSPTPSPRTSPRTEEVSNDDLVATADPLDPFDAVERG